jgi:hypothetical protein
MSFLSRTLVFVLLLAAAGSAAAAPARPATDVCGQLAGNTTWTAAGSPYRTCDQDVEVPAGATLTIEPGVRVELGAFHSVVVKGRLVVQGTAAAPVRFVSTGPGITWGTLTLDAGSGPSEIAHAEFSDGGSGRARTMLLVASSQATVRDTLFTSSEGATPAGAALDIRDASPSVVRSRFIAALSPSADPPGALRIFGASDPVVTANYFQSNFGYAAYWDANASPRFSGNRFRYNGFDAVLIKGSVTRAVTLPSLGPRQWSYRIATSPGITVEPSGKLTIEAGATVRLNSGFSLIVKGALAVRGIATSKVLFTANTDAPRGGSWREIVFRPESLDYDESSGEGSIIDHAIVEYGGSLPDGQVIVQNSSPRISNSIIRYSGNAGMTVTGADARPSVVNNQFVKNSGTTSSFGLRVAAGAAPEVRLNVFRENLVGLRVEDGSLPLAGPDNWFRLNDGYGLFNADTSACVPAEGNNWSAATGPVDPSARTDACGLGRNDGDGDLVSDGVDYAPFIGQLPEPTLSGPLCGTYAGPVPELSGYAVAGSTLVLYDGEAEIARGQAPAGGESFSAFRLAIPPLAPGSHVLRLRSELGADKSGLSEPLEVYVDPDRLVDPTALVMRYELDGGTFVQPFQNAGGCATLRAGDWVLRPHPGVPVTVEAPLACPGGAPATAQLDYGGTLAPMEPGEAGLYRGRFDQASGGPLSVLVTCGETTSELLLGTLTPEYEGFVYDAEGGVLERIDGARVEIFVYDPSQPADRRYVPWNGAAFFGQANPQTTGVGGWYAFYPPPGRYRIRAEAPGYEPYLSGEIEVTTDAEPLFLQIPLAAGAAGGPAIFLPIAYRQ